MLKARGAERKRFRVAIFVPSLLLLDQTEKQLNDWASDYTVGVVGGVREEIEGYDIIVCTYASVDKIVDLEFDLIIVDEAHRMETKVHRMRAEMIDTMVADAFIHASASLDKSEKFDYEYNLENAIAAGHLVDYNIVVPVFETKSDNKAALCALIEEHAEFTHILAYCNTLKSARGFSELLNIKGIPAAHFDGKTPIVERQEIIREFQAGMWRVIVTVYTLSEGVDIPEANTCMFVETRSSPINVQQCVGRVLRLCPRNGKSLAYVVLPAVDESKALDKFIRITSMQDSRVKKALECKNDSKTPRGRIEIISNVETANSEMRYVGIYDRLGKSLKIDYLWDETYDRLFYHMTTYKRYPSGKIRDQRRLYLWYIKMRNHKIAGWLTDEQIAKLEAIPKWYWSASKKWSDKFDILKRFIEDNGRYPIKGEKVGNFDVGQWCTNYRSRKTRDALSAKQIKMFENIRTWTWGSLRDMRWFEMLGLVQAYINENEKLPAQKTFVDGKDIGDWLQQNRTAKKNDKISVERVKALEALRYDDKPVWTWGRMDEWDQWYALILKFVEEYNVTPGCKKVYEGHQLGAWYRSMKRARANNKTGILTPYRLELLKELPGWDDDAAE